MIKKTRRGPCKACGLPLFLRKTFKEGQDAEAKAWDPVFVHRGCAEAYARYQATQDSG